jgi:putative tributyrin esterase
MTKYLRSFLFIALFCSLSGPALHTATDRVSAAHPFHPEAPPDNSRVAKIALKSALMGKTLSYYVLLPVNYYSPNFVPPGPLPNKFMGHYPVLYLLHGGGGHSDQWITITNLSDYAAHYPMIVVMPEGNYGWYTDSATTPKEKYESYIEELIPDVERRFKVLPVRNRRSIAGLSMGGYGALKFGVKHPDKFVFAGSMSGALGPTSVTEQGNLAKVDWDSISNAFGPAGSSTRAANDLYKLYSELPTERIADLPYIYFDCGTEDIIFWPLNRHLTDIFMARKIPHEYRELPGNHNAAYWDKQIQEVLGIAYREMNKP